MRHIYITLLVALVSLTAYAAPRATVSLLTCMEGSDIYELEGHTGLRVQFDNGADMTVNWGVFDFNSPGFVYRFVKGETDYLAAAFPTSLFLQSYRHDGRAVFEQTLALDSLQTERLIELISENLLPENRVYRYNYVLDNCATRPLALIEKAVGDTLTLSSPRVPASERNTFRNAMRHFHANYPWYQFGIDTALGSGIDRTVSEREASFAPVMLADMIAGIARAHPYGAVPAILGMGGVRHRLHRHDIADARHHALGQIVRHHLFRHHGPRRIAADIPHLCLGPRGHLAQLAISLAEPLVPHRRGGSLAKKGETLGVLLSKC